MLPVFIYIQIYHIMAAATSAFGRGGTFAFPPLVRFASFGAVSDFTVIYVTGALFRGPPWAFGAVLVGEAAVVLGSSAVALADSLAGDLVVFDIDMRKVSARASIMAAFSSGD
jgi:hypothetical protein